MDYQCTSCQDSYMCKACDATGFELAPRKYGLLLQTCPACKGSGFCQDCINDTPCLPEYIYSTGINHGSMESVEKITAIAGILGLFCTNKNIARIDIDAAVYLAKIHLDSGASAASALDAGYKILKSSTAL